jgi:DnaJ-class molecular chaperone
VSVIDPPDDVTARCPVCDGTGQVFIDGEPKFCKPCDGTGWVLRDSED